MNTDLEPQPPVDHTKAKVSAPLSSFPSGVNLRSKPPARPSSPGWAIMAMAMIAMVSLLVLGASFSHLTGPQTAGPSQAPATNGGTTSTTSSTDPVSKQVAVPAHQEYNPQAPVALQGSTV